MGKPSSKAGKKAEAKQTKNPKNATTETNDKSVEEIEQDLQIPDSSESESEEELSEESDDDIVGLSDTESTTETSSRKITDDGHSVNKSISKASRNSKVASKDQRGIIYIGRIPHGFYENEMKTYFNQFGNIINLRIARNKKTGKSKHYGFIEFENLATAKVAAETMNNYLLSGHLLKCEIVENFHEDLFKNANKRFNPVAWYKITKEKIDKPKTKEQWTELIERHEAKKLKKQEELKAKGIDFSLSN